MRWGCLVLTVILRAWPTSQNVGKVKGDQPDQECRQHAAGGSDGIVTVELASGK